ncbi:uncharacterized protein LOC120343445 [Styela clava]
MSGLDALASYDISDEEDEEKKVEEKPEKEEKTQTLEPQEKTNDKPKSPSPKGTIEDQEDIWQDPDEHINDDDDEEKEEEDKDSNDPEDAIKDVEDLSVIHDGSDVDEAEEDGGKESSEGEENDDVSNLGDTLMAKAKRRAKRKSSESATNLAKKLRSASVDEVSIPPEPEGRCSSSLQDKITRFMERKVTHGEDLNQAIQSRKDFRNPSIYDKLILYLGIDELGTNFPPQDYNPKRWRKVPKYDELARAQREDMAKREKERKTKVEFVTGTVKKPSSTSSQGGSGDPVKKSKWDQQGSRSSTEKILTHKTTVIPAVGNIKKPKP